MSDLNPAEPDDAGQAVAHWRAAAKGDRATQRPLADFEELRFVLVHASIVPMIRSRFLAVAGRSVAPSGAEGLAERAALVNAPASVRRRGAPIPATADERVSAETLAPFGRAERASLAGRTILQIIPRLDAGGAERTTIDVAAALARAGARALVASEGGRLASELQAVGGLLTPFPAATKNPLAMALNVRRLARLIVEERRRSRSRPFARAGLGRARRLPHDRAAFRHHLSRRL